MVFASSFECDDDDDAELRGVFASADMVVKKQE